MCAISCFDRKENKGKGLITKRDWAMVFTEVGMGGGRSKRKGRERGRKGELKGAEGMVFKDKREKLFSPETYFFVFLCKIIFTALLLSVI